MSLEQDLMWQFTYHGKEIAKAAKAKEIVAALELEEGKEGISYISYNSGGYLDKPHLEISFSPGLTVMMEYLEPSGFMGALAKKLLPKVGRWEKGFSDSNSQISLTTEHEGVVIVLSSSAPKTCTVERVEEEVEVPEKVIPAHKEKKVRFVLKGDCDPLLSPKVAEVPKEEMIGEEIPF